MAAESSIDIFSKYPVASLTILGQTVQFPTLDIRESGGNRIVKRRRPYRDGAKCDDTGSNEKTWEVDAIFENSIDEDGIVNDGMALYPAVAHKLISFFEVHEIGTLVLPTRGEIRVRCETYRRSESFGEIDGCRITLVFVADNEDNVDAQSFAQPTVHATIVRAVDETVFGLQGIGGFTALVDELEDAADKLEEAIAAPGNTIQDIDQQASRVVRTAQRIEDQFSRQGELGRDLLTDPDAWATMRQLRILQDRSKRAFREIVPEAATIVSKFYLVPMSIFDVAVDVAQDPELLLGINSDLPDQLTIPPHTPIRIYSR